MEEAALFGVHESTDPSQHRFVLRALAKNFHAIADSFAPEHRGFQLWNPADLISTARHIWREQVATVTISDRASAVSAIKEHHKLFKHKTEERARMLAVANTGFGFDSFIAPGLF